ncbi:response regulator [Geobacter sp. SVR]|uniref:response regulator n=1 Tax=Geobacter sp. SVR TaxID=2495594 RepID=UPI00143F001C|nr:response regulator [Geobacter sp. SVR]BCS53534.1 hypothetical protein GSVR_18420 [Geobacter sp. SVR]GCF84269.1 hypothetical protein GSbR_08690 [Geobacter sp. SVR]
MKKKKKLSNLMRFLVVNADRHARILISGALDGLGRIDEAENGREALFKFITSSNQGKPYGVIVLDHEMPVMNGSETYRMIRLFELDHHAMGGTTTFLLTSEHTDLEETFSHALGRDPHLKVLGNPRDLGKLRQFLYADSDSEK